MIVSLMLSTILSPLRISLSSQILTSWRATTHELHTSLHSVPRYALGRAQLTQLSLPA